MRSHRLLVALTALVALALTATLSTAPSASARDARPAATSGAVTASERAADIVITAAVVKKRLRPDRPRRLVFEGTVEPAKGPVYVQRATRCVRGDCTRPGHFNFKFYRKVFLKKGAWQAVIDAPPTLRGWLWRAKVKTTYSEIWQTCTKRKQQNCKVPTKR